VIGRHRMQRADRGRGGAEGPRHTSHAMTSSKAMARLRSRQPSQSSDAESAARGEGDHIRHRHRPRQRVEMASREMPRYGIRSTFVSSTRSACEPCRVLYGLSSPSVTDSRHDVPGLPEVVDRGTDRCRRSR